MDECEKSIQDFIQLLICCRVRVKQAIPNFSLCSKYYSKLSNV